MIKVGIFGYETGSRSYLKKKSIYSRDPFETFLSEVSDEKYLELDTESAIVYRWVIAEVNSRFGF